MIFKTFDSKIDKWTSKIGIFGKSFNELGTAVNEAFKSVIDNLDNFDENVGFRESLKNNLSNKDWIKNSLGEIISTENIDSYIKKLDLESAKEKLSEIFNWDTSIKNNETTWEKFFDTCKGGNEYLIDLIKNTKDLSKLEGQDLVDACNKARESVIAHNKEIKNMSPSAKAGQVALQALATAGNMLAMWAISKVISVATEKITNLANASQIAQEKASGFANSVNTSVADMSSNASTLSELNEEYQQLSQGVNSIGENVSLSADQYNRYKEIIQQVSDIMPNMTTYFNAQGEKIAFAKGELSDLNDEYETYIQKQAKEFLVNGDNEGNTLQDTLDNFDNNSKMGFWEALKNTIKNSFGSYDIDDLPVDTMISTLEALQNKSREEMITYLNDIDLDLNGQYLQTEDNRSKAAAQRILHTTTGKIKNMTDEEFNTLQQSISSNIESLKNSNDVDMSAITSGLLQTAYSKDAFWAMGEDLRNNVTTLLSSINADTWKSLGITEQSELETFVSSIINSISSNKNGVADAWNNLFSLDVEAMPANEYIEEVNTFIDTIASMLGLDEEGKRQFTIALGFDLETKQGMINGLKKKLKNSSSNVTAGAASAISDFLQQTTNPAVDSWVDTLSESELELANSDAFMETLDAQEEKLNGAALTAKDYEAALQSVKSAQAEIDTPETWDYSETINQLDTLKEKFSSLDKTYAKLFDDDASTNIGFEDFSSLNAAFKDLDGIDRYIQRLQEAGQNQEAVTMIMSDLTGAYINQTGILDNVTDQNAALIEQTLTEIGIEGAHELVTRQLAAAKEIAALQSFNLADATFADIQKLIEEKQVSDEAGNYLLTYALKKELANGTTLTTASDIENIKALVLALGGAVNALERFQTVKNGLPVKLSNPNDKKIHTGNNSVYVEGTYDSSPYQEDAQKEIDDILNAPYHFGGGSSTNSTKNYSSTPSSGSSSSPSTPSSTPAETSQTFDWIETRLDVLSRKTSELSDAFSNAYGLDAKNEAYLNYLSAIQEEIDANSTAIAYYEQRLNEIGLSYEWIAKIQSGAFDISTITDQTLIDQIQQYQSFYEKILGYQDNNRSLEQQRQKAQADHARDVVDTYDQEIDAFQKIIDQRKSFVSLKELFGGSASKKDLETQQDAVGRQINRIEEQNRGLDQLIRTTTYGSEAWQIYRDKIEKNKDSISDFTQSLAELAKEIANLPLDELDSKLEKISKKKEQNDAKIENATTAKERNELINQQMKLTKKENKKTQEAAVQTEKNLDVSIETFSSAKKTDKKYAPKDQQKKIDAYYKQIKTYTKSKKQIPPDLITKLTEEGHSNLAQAAVNYNAALEANDTAQAAAALSAETTKTNLAGFAKTKFDNVQTKYERKQNQISNKASTVNTKMELANAKGYLDSQKWYEQLIAYEQQQQNSLQAEATALQKRLDTSLSFGNIEKYSDEWWEMTEAIQSVNESLEQGEITLQEYKNQLEQIKSSNFDFLQQQISRLTSEADFFIDLMADKDLTDDNGLTDYGTATLGLHYQNYDTYLAQAEKYGEEIARINGQLANDPYNTTLLSQLQEREDAQRDCILAAEKEKSAIIDLKKQGYDALATSLSNVISKYKETLRSAKDAHDYQKNIAEQSENITSLQRKITAYTSLSGNEEIAAKLQQANKELAEAQEDLEETMYDKYISDTEDILDDLLDELEAYIDELISSVDSEFTATRELVNQNAEGIKGTLNDLSASYNTSLSSAVKEIWKDGYTPEKGFTSILDKMDELIAASNEQADRQADAFAYEEVKDSYNKSLSDYENNVAVTQSRLENAKNNQAAAKEKYDNAKAERDNLKQKRDKIAKEYGTNSKKYKKANENYLAAKEQATALKAALDAAKANTSNAQNSYDTAVKERDSVLSGNKAVVQDFLNRIVNTEPTKPEEQMTTLDNAIHQLTGGYITDYNVQQLADLMGTGANSDEILAMLEKLGVTSFQGTPPEPDTNHDAVFQEAFSDQDIALSGAKSKESLSEDLTDRKPGLMSSAKSDQTSAISRHDKTVLSQALPEFSLAVLEANLPPMNQLFNTSPTASLNNTFENSISRETVNVDLGGITMYGVNDPEAFGKQLREEICKNGRTTKCLTEAVASKITNRGIGTANLYR